MARKSFLFFFLFSLFCSAHAQIDKKGDFQFWQRAFVIKHIDDRWCVWSLSETRFGDDASKLYYVLQQAQVFYKLFSWVSIGPGYQQVWTREPPAKSWKPQYLPFIDVIFRARISQWEIQDRNRTQYVLYDSDPSHWLYRNRFRIIAPSMLTEPRLSFFVDNEFFWLERKGVCEDRLSGGVMIQWQDNWGGEAFYTARFLDEASGWIQLNVLTLALLFSF